MIYRVRLPYHLIDFLHHKTFGVWMLYLLVLSGPRFSFAQHRYDILIAECLPDPSPSVGLPESSFVEITNHSKQPVNLRNWKIGNGRTTATLKADLILDADSFLILCSTSASNAYSHWGSVLGIPDFPALNNEEDDIILWNDSGQVVHAIHYHKDWFDNELKAAGGWSLEMIDLSNPSGGQRNWGASIAGDGGSPGRKNSIAAMNPDQELPALIRAYASDSLTLILTMNESIDSLSAADISNYFISGGTGPPVSARAMPPFFDKIECKLTNPLLPGVIYSVEVHHLYDICSNEIGTGNNCVTGLASKVKNNDLIFNEILFNPPLYGYDYIEILNRSTKIIDCSGLYIAGRKPDGSFKDPVAITLENRSFFPGEYLLLTENPEWVLHQYPLSDAGQILFIKSLPSMPDDLGNIVLVDKSGEIIDELAYDHHWHAPILASENGVALERIRADASTNMAMNWTSAASDAGYGTPGYKNSESHNDSFYLGKKFISADSKVFSPDMDGYQDYCFLHYQLPDAGFSGSISVYDISGNIVRRLIDNNLWSSTGMFRWDGLDDQSKPLPTGRYIIYAEIFKPDGGVRSQKIVIALVRNQRK